MAFLDNSGDIILDAVLTDTGRMRLAKGDGSFRIAKFALGDDEIDYSLYDSANPSGSAYYDLQILQTPIFEAFSNNAASMKSKLLSISKTNLIYLPVLKVNETKAPFNLATTLVNGGYVFAVDEFTQNFLTSSTQYNGVSVRTQGTLFGFKPESAGLIKLTQGIDASIPKLTGLDPDLIETQYLIEIDNRIASIVSSVDLTQQKPSYVDDDNIATYYFSTTDTKFVTFADNSNNSDLTIKGPAGTNLEFKLKSQLDVSTSDYLFNTLGKALTGTWSPTANVRGILTNIRVIGATTGNYIDIPLMVLKRIS